jgi:hypothetical protein
VYGGCTVLFALSPVFWFSVLLLAGSGAGNLVSAVLRGTINQISTPNELRGRVGAVNSIFVQGGPQLGQFESGIVAQAAGTRFSAASGGLACLLIVGGLAFVPWIRSFRFAAPTPSEVKTSS